MDSAWLVRLQAGHVETNWVHFVHSWMIDSIIRAEVYSGQGSLTLRAKTMGVKLIEGKIHCGQCPRPAGHITSIYCIEILIDKMGGQSRAWKVQSLTTRSTKYEFSNEIPKLITWTSNKTLSVFLLLSIFFFMHLKVIWNRLGAWQSIRFLVGRFNKSWKHTSKPLT